MATEQNTEKNGLATLDKTAAVDLNLNTLDGFVNIQRAATMLSRSSLLPEAYQGNVPNCAIVLDMANRMKASPMMVAQNLYIVSNRPAWSSKFLIATFNQCGRYSSIDYDFTGEPGTDGYGCRAYAVERVTKKKLTGPLVTIGTAKAEGWYSKNGSKWKTMAEQMLRYRAAAWFVNTVAPELAMGLPTSEEVHDFVVDADIVPDRSPAQRPSFVDWPIADLEAFDALMDTAHQHFTAAGYANHFEAFAAPWRTKRGRGDAYGVLEEFEAAVGALADKSDAEAADE
jgi:hypothetical protein